MQSNTEKVLINSDEKPKISVIIPIFNVEKYLKVMLKSLLIQTYSNLEIILINDGSTDNSGKLCDKFSKIDTRIRVIHKNNQGAAAARNYALDICTGKFITFLDGDDVIAKNYIDKLYQVLVENNADISICNFKEIEEDEKREFDQKEFGQTMCFSTLEALEKLLYQEEFDSAMWCKLYKKNLFNQIRFPIGNLYEDIAIIYKVFELAKKICFIDYKGYGYRQRKSGTTMAVFHEKKMDLIDVIDDMEKYLLKKYPSLEKAIYARATRANFHIYLQIPNTKKNKVYQKRIKKNIRKYRSIVQKDKRVKKGTKIALVISIISFRLLTSLKSFKKHGKQ